jgi:hypothetical protein
MNKYKICKQCGCKYQEREVRRAFGNLPANAGVCSSVCYTQYIYEEKEEKKK